MPSKARVMVVALDAADPTLVRELARAGEMPTMARLLREAAIVETRAPAGVFVSANWPTIFTATSPDRHRYLCWEEIRGGTYEHRLTSPSMVRGTPIWERLSEAGRRVAALDVPHSLVGPVNGAVLVEWGCHDRHHTPASWPPDLAGELSAR
ncbi:MAG: alkaline phosphatase family protein, partial [Chloroflexota bacterium]|nr:alkaline phosphatase family protein [Chloroflexota bacterium]